MKRRGNYWINSGFFALGQRLSGPLFGIGSFLILVRAFTPDQLGIWSLYLSLSTTAEVARNGLLKSALVKYYGESTGDVQLVVKSSSFIINCLYTLLISLISFLLSGWLGDVFESEELVLMLQIYGITSLLYLPFSHLEYVQQSVMKFRGVFFSYFARQGLLFLFIVLGSFELIGISLPNLVLFQAVGLVTGSIISWYYTKEYVSMKWIKSRRWINELWSFGKFGFMTNIGTSITTTADHFLIGGLMSTNSVGMYNVAARITNLFTIPSVAIADILYPKTVRSHASQNLSEVKKLYENAVAVTLVAMIPAMILVVLFPLLIVQIIAGSGYEQAAVVLRVSIITIVLRPFLTQFGTIMNTLGLPKWNFVFVLLMSSTNVLLNYLFITEVGIIGAAIANLTTMLLGIIGSQIVLSKKLNISFQGVLSHLPFYYKKIYKIVVEWKR